MLSRATAAAIINRALARAAWVAGIVILVVTVLGLFDVFLRDGLIEGIATPLLAIIGMIAMAAVISLRPSPWRVVLYLIVAGACAVVYQVSILSADPALATDASYLLNQPAVALVLIGTLSSSAIAGALWPVAGYLVSVGVTLVAVAVSAVPLAPGPGPASVCVSFVAVNIALAVTQRRRARHVPDFAAAEQQARRMASERDAVRRAVTVVHNTLLGDLDLVIAAPESLGTETRKRFRDDISSLTGAEQSTQAGEEGVDTPAVREMLDALVNDMQWRGLTVHLSGSAALRCTESAGVAAVEATRASLENILEHSGVDVAQVVLSHDVSESVIMVTDEGVGFDQRSPSSHGRGLPPEVIGGVEDAGGHVRVWSTPDSGTAVVITVPVLGTEPATSVTGQAS